MKRFKLWMLPLFIGLVVTMSGCGGGNDSTPSNPDQPYVPVNPGDPSTPIIPEKPGVPVEPTNPQPIPPNATLEQMFVFPANCNSACGCKWTVQSIWCLQ